MANQDIALLFLFGGIVGIYLEFCRPGSVAPGVLGSVSVLMGIARLMQYPLDWRGIALIAAAFGFFIPANRFFSAAGSLLMFGGLMILLDQSRTQAHIHAFFAAAVTIPFALLSNFLFSVALAARRNKMPVDILREQAKSNHDSVG